MKITVYLPDELGAEVQEQLAEANVSKIVQGALRAELARRREQPDPPADEDYHWRFVGFTCDINGRPGPRLYAHREHAECYAVVAEEDRQDHLYWCRKVVQA